ncbi:MAG TPA: hypothetical protein DCE78_06330 [Bacteroidetes bacterium]|nr:hypothetical protein [Bacteroidota bacterium]
MKILMITLLLFIYGINTFEYSNETESRGIDFKDLLISEALNTAKIEGKDVYISFFTTWCASCQFMKLNIYKKRDVGEVFNNRFISLQINGERGEGIEAAKKYNVEMFPTLLILNAETGEIKHKATGFHDASALIIFAKSVDEDNTLSGSN